MLELGKTLSQARIARGLTLEDCERDTRISKRYLDALEREDWKIFPAPVYSRAFLRTYAQYLGLSPNDLMRQFHQQTVEPPEFKPLPEIRPAPATGNMNWWLAGGVVVFLSIAGIFLYLSSRGGGNGSVNARAAATPTAVAEAQGGGPPPQLGRAVGPVTKGTVPDLRQVLLDEAIGALTQAGLNYVVVETNTVAGVANTVVSQDPAPGTKASGDTSVTLVVPRGS
jgi:transcriptional regulator with XRE-family HTH domain